MAPGGMMKYWNVGEMGRGLWLAEVMAMLANGKIQFDAGA